MHRNVGVCTWIFGANPLDDTFARIARLGADGVELLGDLAAATDDVRRALHDHGLEVYSLTPANVDIAHPSRRERDAAIDYYYRLIDFAGEIGKPLVSCHGLVTRYRAITTQAEESRHMVGSVTAICGHAERAGVGVALEVLNRYETHLLNTAEQVLEFVDEIAVSNLGIVLDSYHMNIEEADPFAAICSVGSRLRLYHAADSNREAIGRGHIDFERQLEALQAIDYAGPIILECTAPGPNPFTPEKGTGFLDVLETHLAESIARLRRNER
jgi:D-psicose/D-tagatose/L-ribulose 3-epimerase